jgi:Ni,Fe-hydrogenase I small subunit
MSQNLNFQRLSYLGDRLRAGLATKSEKDEYMLILYKNGSITQQQYNEYLANGNKTNTEEIVNAALAVGAIVLIGYLLKEMFKGK